MSVQVVMPFAGSCPHRLAALDWVAGRYPWPVTVAPGPDPWCKAAAVMPAVASSTADVLVVADADVWTDGIYDAVHEVEAGASWAIPHDQVHRLTPESTGRVLAGISPAGQPALETYRGVPGGGIVVAPREVLLAVPLDPRFVGWGQEDESWATALACLLGEPWRGDADLFHLWHPPQPRMCRRRGNPDGWRLRRRYLNARHNPATMRRLLAEITDGPSEPSQPDGHDHDPHGQRVH